MASRGLLERRSSRFSRWTSNKLRVMGEEHDGARGHGLIGDRCVRLRSDRDRGHRGRRYREVEAAVLLVHDLDRQVLSTVDGQRWGGRRQDPGAGSGLNRGVARRGAKLC